MVDLRLNKGNGGGSGGGPVSDPTALKKSKNLSDLGDVSVALENLGLDGVQSNIYKLTQSIANLSGASGQFGSEDKQEMSSTPTTMNWDIITPSSDNNILKIKSNSVVFKKVGRYEFQSDLTLYRESSSNAVTVTFALKSIEGILLKTVTESMKINIQVPTNITLNTLLDIVEDDMVDNELEMIVEMSFTGNGKLSVTRMVSIVNLSQVGAVSIGSGLSAYEIAVKNGFVGTEQEWLESLGGNILPEYSEDDTNKVLTVDDKGELSWKMSSGGGASEYFTGSAGITVGGIATGETFTDVPVTEMINNLINPELNPTLTAPSNALTSTISGLREVGTTVVPRLTATFNRGAINPQYQANEPYRAGLPTKYKFTSNTGLDIEIESSSTSCIYDVDSFEVAVGAVTYSSNVSYSTGPQPTTSKGNIFNTPLAGSTTANKTITITGVYACYNGISSLTKMALAAHGGSITVDAPADMNVGGDRFKIQYPNVWSAKTPIVQQENELSKAWDNQNMTEYVISSIDKNGVPYKQVEYVGSGIGARKLRLVF